MPAPVAISQLYLSVTRLAYYGQFDYRRLFGYYPGLFKIFPFRVTYIK